jgi:hypothetical protein
MVITLCPNDDVTDILNYGDSTHFVSTVFNNNHFVVLYYDIAGQSVTVFDGLNMSIDKWLDHIVHTIRTYGLEPLKSKWKCNVERNAYIVDEGNIDERNIRKCAKKKGRRDMLIRIDFENSGIPWHVSNNKSYEQSDGINCGPVACMKIMEIYAFIEPGRIAQIGKKKGNYRSVVMDYYSKAIQRFNSVLRFETRFDEVTRNNMGKETKDSKLPPARRTSPRKTGVVEKLAGVFEKEGTAGNMTWLIH